MAMDGGIRPIDRFGTIAMFDRIKVDVIDMGLQILVVPDQMFLIAALPDTALPFSESALPYPLCFGELS